MQIWQTLLLIVAVPDIGVLIWQFPAFWRVIGLVANGKPDESIFPTGVVAPNGVTAQDRPVMNFIRFYSATFMCTGFLLSVAFGTLGQGDGAMLAAAILGTLSVILPQRTSRLGNAVASVL